MMPATPTSTALLTAALEEVAGLDAVPLGAVLDRLIEDGEVLEVPGGDEAVVGVVVTPAGVDTVPEVAGVEAPLVEDPPALLLGSFPTQLVSDPDWTVKGADWAVAPVESRRVRPREVLGSTFTIQVIGEP